LFGVGAHGTGHGDRCRVLDRAQQPQVKLDHLGPQQRNEGKGLGLRSDVVQGDGAAGGTQPLGAGQHPCEVCGQRPLGDLDDHLNMPGAIGERLEDDVQSLGHGAGLDVDEQRHRLAAGKACRIRQRRAQRRPFQVREPSGGAGGIQEHHRRLPPGLRGSPQQCLVGQNGPGVHVDERLKDETSHRHAADRRGSGRRRSGRSRRGSQPDPAAS
jgi:hypothetical protein